MFNNLIESGSHRRDLARRGRFLLGTLALYSALVAASGVAGVYAYNARLDAQAYEVTILPPWALPAAKTTVTREPPARTNRGNAGEVPVRREAILDLNTTPRTTPPVSTAASNAKTMPKGFFVIGLADRDPVSSGVAGPAGTGPAGSDPAVSNAPSHAIVVRTEDPRPPEAVRPAPALAPRGPLSLSRLIASKVLNKPVPAYPQIAKVARVQGTVTVEILVDEQGRVVSATAKDGPALLREAARQAAMQARFTPTQLNGEPVKVSGVISYNFVLQ